MASSCPKQQHLNAFLAGTVDPQHQLELEEHVETCSNCQDTLENVFASQTKLLVGTDSSLANSSSANIPGWGNDLARRISRSLAQLDVLAQPDEPGIELEKIGDYQILAKIGAGGMGAVYQAYHPKLHKTVAIKILPIEKTSDRRAVARFEREIRAAGKLDHPNIVRAMDAGEDNGIHFLVMEYVDGIDLSNLSKQLGPLPVSAACELIRQAALGLEEAHESGLIHRDIKPANLILAKRRRQPPLLKLLDMGLAQFSRELGEQQHELTHTDQIMGTLDYMAPEQGTDSHNVDIRADIYSLGATLYRLLTGQVLFHGEQYSSLIQKVTAIATETPPPVQSKRKEIPARLAKIVHRMLKKNPSKRFSTPQEVANALVPFAAGANLQALMDVRPPETGQEAISHHEISEQDSVSSQSRTTTHLSVLQETPRESHSVEFARIENAQNKAGAKQQRLGFARRWTTRPMILVGIGLLFLASVACGMMIVFQSPQGTFQVVRANTIIDSKSLLPTPETTPSKLSPVVKQTTNVDIRLDLCASDAPESEIQAGFIRLTAVGITGERQEGVFVPTANIDGITISVRQPEGLELLYRDRGFFVTGKLLPPYPNVLRDFVGRTGKGATIEVTIENLPEGNYLVSTFHFDWHNGSNDNFFHIFVDDASGTNQKKIDNAYFLNSADFDDGQSFHVKSNGTDVLVIRLVAAKSINAVYFNGITILSDDIDGTTNPGTAPPSHP